MSDSKNNPAVVVNPKAAIRPLPMSVKHVLFGVAGAMLTIFYAFAGRVAEIRDKDW